MLILDNPYTLEKILEVPFLNLEEQLSKLEKAKLAYKANKKLNVEERKTMIYGLLDYLTNVIIALTCFIP